MDQNLFLIVLAFVAIIIAVVQDFKRREVANWLNFSLIIFALAYRLFYSMFSSDYGFIIQGVIGVIIFLILGNIFYYSRLFAGGDAKLVIALGAILPLSDIFKQNLNIYLFFIFSFLLFGGIYGLIYSFFILARNRKLFSRNFNILVLKMKPIFYASFIISVILAFLLLAFNLKTLLLIPIIFLVSPFLLVYAKALEEAMVFDVKTSKLTEGDWLYEEIIIKSKGKTIKVEAGWEGLNQKQIEILKKYKKSVKVKQGIPFTPSFLLAFIFIVYLWYSSWKFVYGFFF